MTPAERVVVEAAVRWAGRRRPTDPRDIGLWDAVDALLAERNGPQPETVEITWGQVVEGDRLYRMPNGAPAQPGRPGVWMEVVGAGALPGGQCKIHVKGIGRPIQPTASKPVRVQRGATGKAVDALGSVLWSGRTAVEL